VEVDSVNRIAIFTGNAHPDLASAVCDGLKDDGIRLGSATVSQFSDGETQVQIQENVRGATCFILQPTCSPANHNLMELLIMVDALRRASAGSITAVIPYYGYARQDRKSASRSPITSKLVANLITMSGVDRVVSVDLHAAQIQGFFDIPHDHLFAKRVLVPYLTQMYRGAVIVSPDAGGVERARAYSKAIPETSLAIIDKRRERANVSEVMNIIGDVRGKRCLIIDDLIDTAGTLVNAATALVEHGGAASVSACATHGVFSGEAHKRLHLSDLEEVVVTDTLPQRPFFENLDRAGKSGPKMTVVSVAPLLAEAIRRIHDHVSVSSLFL
jgi:ribose-phosphate pyrophosphokinase